MPVLFAGDGIYYLGSRTDFNTLTLYATFYAGLNQGLDLDLTGNPPIFFPSGASPAVLDQFIIDFAEIFQQLVPYVENSASV